MQTWNAQFYDNQHSFVFKYGEEVVQLLHPQAGERILDLGSGTGHLTKKIADAGAEVMGIDRSPEMITQAQSNYPELTFRQMDGADFRFEQPFDAVFSNATLHWIHEAEKVIACVYHALKPGGRLVAELGGKGNVQRILTALQTALYEKNIRFNVFTNYFPSVAEYTSLLEKAGFRVRLAAHFDRDTELQDPQDGVIEWIRMFRSEAWAQVNEKDQPQVAERIKEQLKPTNFRDDKWFADYKRLRIVATREA